MNLNRVVTSIGSGSVVVKSKLIPSILIGNNVSNVTLTLGLYELFRIMREYSLGVSKDKLTELYQNSIQENKQDFLFIDLEAEPAERFRYNFLDVYNIGEMI